jgi:CRP/FNR family cyclic AMP-dependent transcriptional regulator
VTSGELGRVYEDGELILREGEEGDRMYVIQEGQVQVFVEREGKQVSIAVRGEGEFFGEMALFEREVRSANVRARGRTRVLSLDKRNFLKRIQEDPTLAFRIVETMSRRIRELTAEVVRLRSGDEREVPEV